MYNKKQRPMVGPGMGRKPALRRPLIGRPPSPRLNKGPSVRGGMPKQNRKSPGYGGSRTMRTPGIGNTLMNRKRNRGY